MVSRILTTKTRILTSSRILSTTVRESYYRHKNFDMIKKSNAFKSKFKILVETGHLLSTNSDRCFFTLYIYWFTEKNYPVQQHRFPGQFLLQNPYAMPYQGPTQQMSSPGLRNCWNAPEQFPHVTYQTITTIAQLQSSESSLSHLVIKILVNDGSCIILRKITKKISFLLSWGAEDSQNFYNFHWFALFDTKTVISSRLRRVKES